MEPRYVALTKRLLNDISSGLYPVGASLPGELELAGKYGVSRGTVRAALDQIQALGLISRRKRAGTRVESAVPRNPEYGPTISTLEELVQYGADAQRVVHSVRDLVIDIDMSARLGCPPGSRWTEIQTSRMNPVAPAYPLAWSNVYVRAADAARIRRSLRRSQSLICDLICEMTGAVVKEVRQTVRAVGVPAELADKLSAQEGDHALEFVRQYYDQSSTLFEVAVSLQPADRFSYTTVLQRQASPPA
ncbi:GntR family transcriptional regulator [Bordetella petrii]|nr:GntR family transcriptional regulator [Bordetella petrii]